MCSDFSMIVAFMENLIYNVLFTFKNLNCESSQRPWNIKAVYCAIKYGKKNSPSEFVKNTQNLIRLDSGASMRLEAKKSKQKQFNKLIYKYNPNTFFWTTWQFQTVNALNRNVTKLIHNTGDKTEDLNTTWTKLQNTFWGTEYIKNSWNDCASRQRNLNNLSRSWNKKNKKTPKKLKWKAPYC